MPAPYRRIRRWVLYPAAGIALLFVASRLADRRPPEIREYADVRTEWEQSGHERTAPEKARLAARSLEVGRKYPGTAAGISAQLLAATLAPETSAGRDARNEFAGQLETADIGSLAQALDWGLGRWQAIEDLVPKLLARARRSPGDPRTARLLVAVCDATRPRDERDPPPAYVEAADLIADQYADSPEISHLCEGLGASPNGSPPWASRFERHLRAILRVNKDRAVRCTALFALASTLQSALDDRQTEARALYEQFCNDFDGTFAYPFQPIEQTLNSLAHDQLKELRFRAVGKPASEIVSVDLDGRAITLSQYQGRVVLLSFWGSWCFPCMKLIPRERELAARLRNEPFAIVGVNCDPDLEKARLAVASSQMTWSSFRNQGTSGPAITEHWKILGYPTLYLIDHHGIIRRRWIGSPPAEELDSLTEVLVDSARRQLSVEQTAEVVAKLRPPTPTQPSAPRVEHGAARSGAKFLEKTHRDPDGIESKYALFVPGIAPGVKALPAILYLHGAGGRGSDGRSLLANGLARAIEQRGADFPFVAIFPQARADECWRAGTPGGNRALAILDQVRSEYPIDSNRIALTGHSMGGEGTWSLGASEPQRWAAIVPIAHGANSGLARSLKDLPCWCFHGDADEVIPVEQSREMIRAIQAAGGRPLYQELPGRDHNGCPDRVYTLPELWEWLLLQDRSK